MINFIRSIGLILGLVLLFNGCESPVEKQVDYLLPSSNKLELAKKKEIGITVFSIYKVEGNVNTDELTEFPINVISEKEKAIIKWHKPTEKELQDVRAFIEEEQSSNKIATLLLSQLSDGNHLMALIYDKDNSPLGDKNYSVYDWMELYFLNLSDKEIIHISYGKF